jgi:hypothetical protein
MNQSEQRCSLLVDEDKNKNEVLNNQENNNNLVDKNNYTFTRCFIFFIGLTAVILNTFYGFALPHGNVECLLDKSFEYTADFNKYLHNNLFVRNIIIAVSSFCVDFVILYMGIYWSLYGKSWRLLMVLFCFYTFRGLVQVIYLFILYRMFFK